MLVAVIVYVAKADAAVGVPLMRPVEELNPSPAGNDGEIDQDVAVPPEFVGERDAIGIPITPEIVVGVKEMEGAGTVARTSMLNEAELLPVELVPVTVYVVEDAIAVGVPEMFPFVELKARPAGKEGEILHKVAGDPMFRGATTAEATSLYIVKEVGE